MSASIYVHTFYSFLASTFHRCNTDLKCWCAPRLALTPTRHLGYLNRITMHPCARLLLRPLGEHLIEMHAQSPFPRFSDQADCTRRLCWTPTRGTRDAVVPHVSQCHRDLVGVVMFHSSDETQQRTKLRRQELRWRSRPSLPDLAGRQNGRTAAVIDSDARSRLARCWLRLRLLLPRGYPSL